MSRKNLILAVFASIILIIVGLLFFYFSSSNTGTTATSTTQTTNPFGNTSTNKPTSTTTQAIQGTGQGTGTSINIAKLIQIYSSPTSGEAFSTNNNNQNVLRFTDRAVGHTYQYSPESQTGEPTRITNTTIPKIQETVWSNTGNNLILRYLDNDTDNIVSFSAKINTGTTSINSNQDLAGSFLPAKIKQLSINPKGDKVFALVDKSDKSGTYGFTSNLDGSGKKTIFDSPVSYWNISWPKENTITLTTKPSYKDSGLLYFFNTQTYSMDRMLGNFAGLSTITNKDASLIAYSYSIGNSFTLSVYDAINRISKGINIATLADKCVWGNNNPKFLYCAVPQMITADNYPDAWYQGTESFSDDIWKIDTDTGSMSQIYQIGSNENVNIDAINLKISSDDKYLAFSNKNDLSLWLLKTGN